MGFTSPKLQPCSPPLARRSAGGQISRGLGWWTCSLPAVPFCLYRPGREAPECYEFQPFQTCEVCLLLRGVSQASPPSCREHFNSDEADIRPSSACLRKVIMLLCQSQKKTEPSTGKYRPAFSMNTGTGILNKILMDGPHEGGVHLSVYTPG